MAVKFADLYHQKISVYEVSPDFFFFPLNSNLMKLKENTPFLILSFSNLPIDPSCLASPQWSLSSERLNAPYTLQPELKSMALFCIFVIVSVR